MDEVLGFWFKLSQQQIFGTDVKLDEQIKSSFLDLHRQAAKGELWEWRETADGSLAEIILLDQMSRNMFRGTAEAFAYDGIALVLAQHAVSKNFHQTLPPERAAFLVMPYMHSESAKIHELAVKLYQTPGMESNLDFERKHQEVIQRFGRYPSRNEILGRVSTPEEIEFLTKGAGW